MEHLTWPDVAGLGCAAFALVGIVTAMAWGSRG
jgi:hypothetical protein